MKKSEFHASSSVGVLFLHIIVLIGGMLINPMGGKRFAVAFLVLYIVYLIHITVSLVRFMRSVGKQ